MGQLEDALARIMASAVDASEKQSTFRGMLYGNDGTGKTVLTAQVMKSLVKPGDLLLYIDTSEGYVSLRNIPGLSDGFKIVPFTTFEDLRILAKAIKDKVGPFANVKGIVLDELSKMVIIDANRVYEARVSGAYGDKEANLAKDQGVKEGRDYMFALERFQKVWDELLDLRDVHLIATAHQKDRVDKQGNIIGIEPNLSPKIGKHAREMLHLVAHITSRIVKDVNDLKATAYERTAQVHPSVSVLAKCRLPIKTTSIPAASLPDIIGEWASFGGQEVSDDTIRGDIDPVPASNLFDE